MNIVYKVAIIRVVIKQYKVEERGILWANEVNIILKIIMLFIPLIKQCPKRLLDEQCIVAFSFLELLMSFGEVADGYISDKVIR